MRITHRIWEQKDVGSIHDTSAHDCRVWDDVGLRYGRDEIVADTVRTNAAIPDMRLAAADVIWAGDASGGFHTSHRTMTFGTNTGFSRFGPPRGAPCDCCASPTAARGRARSSTSMSPTTPRC